MEADMPVAEISYLPGCDASTPPRFPDAHAAASKGRAPHPLIAGGTLVGILYCARVLAMPEASIKTLVAVIRDLVRDAGFPQPNPRRWQGRTLTHADAVGPRSLWNRADVDAWAALRSPPHGGGATGSEAHRALAADATIHARLAAMGGAA
jgi:hypothetical protein